MLKVELHTHTADDPVDEIPYTTRQLIDRVAQLGYQALAVTLHDRQLDIRPFASYAAERGVTLIPGVERTIEGRHVLLLNFRRGAMDVRSFEGLAWLKANEPGLIIAPHPFFPLSESLREKMDLHASLFDAVEWHGMFTNVVNFNRAAERWARAHGKPIVGNGDVHRLFQLGTTWSVIDAAPDPDAICEAIRQGRVEVQTKPMSWVHAVSLAVQLSLTLASQRMRGGKQLVGGELSG